jgi:hypothetical protein
MCDDRLNMLILCDGRQQAQEENRGFYVRGRIGLVLQDNAGGPSLHLQRPSISGLVYVAMGQSPLSWSA